MLVVALGPTALVRSPFAPVLLDRLLRPYGFQADFQRFRVGWISPIQVSDLRLVGLTSGTRASVDQVAGDLNLLRLLLRSTRPINWSANGVNVDATVGSDGSSLQADLDAWLQTASTPSWWPEGMPPTTVDLQNLQLAVTDTDRNDVWSADQVHMQTRMGPQEIAVELSGIVSTPTADSGSIVSSLRLPRSDGHELTFQLQCQGLPLEVSTLAHRCLPELFGELPALLDGDATGSLRVTRSGDGSWAIDARQMEFRGLTADDPLGSANLWRSDLAVIDGQARLTGTSIVGNAFTLATDFASLRIDGRFTLADRLTALTDPLGWLRALDGTATAEVDLPLLAQRLPGLLPLNPRTELIAGTATAEVTSGGGDQRDRRVEAKLRCEPISARTGGRQLLIPPIDLVASVHIDARGNWRAEPCELTSAFGTATLQGQPASGQGSADIDLGRLASLLQPVLDLSDVNLGGVVRAELSWTARQGGPWELFADATASDLLIALPAGLQVNQSTVALHLDATGRWDEGRLTELASGEVTLRAPSLRVDLALLQPLGSPSLQDALPLRVIGSGRLESLTTLVGPWLPDPLSGVQGGFQATFEGNFARQSSELQLAQVALDEPQIHWGGHLYRQPQLQIDFTGRLRWPDFQLTTPSLSLTGSSLAMAIKGDASPELVDLKLAWQADLEQLQAAVQPRLADSTEHITRLASAPSRASPSGNFRYAGQGEGTLRLRRQDRDAPITAEVRVDADDLVLRQPDPRPNANGADGEIVWAEPRLHLDGTLSFIPQRRQLRGQQLEIETAWMAARLDGQLDHSANGMAGRLAGPARVDMAAAAIRLQAISGTDIELEGIHEAPLEIDFDLPGDGDPRLRMITNIGWESGRLAGLQFGQAILPLVITQRQMTIQPATIPVGQGRLSVAGELHYFPVPRLQVPQGELARNIRLTPALSNRWMHYLAPMVAQATQVDGTFGVELAEAEIRLDDPARSHLRGQLQIAEVDFDAGPMADQWLTGIRQLRMLARGLSGQEVVQPSETPRPVRLAKLPTQSVDFSFADGVVSHQRMFVDVDQVRLITSGRVHLDGRLNLVTQLPLEATWLGGDLRGLAGQTVTLPISGTLSAPRLDPAAIRDLAGQVGARAAQSTAENYLERQLNRGLERLLGR